MSKILFVEDQLTQNIPRLIKLFSKYLTKNLVKRLGELDVQPYPPNEEEVINILQSTKTIDVAYRFPDALERIESNQYMYSCYIVDRNLSDREYDYDEIKSIEPSFSEDMHDRYFEREGDYLLLHLAKHNVDVKSFFYFLTAYSAKSELVSAPDLHSIIDMGLFKVENFIEKGNSSHMSRLVSIIDCIDVLTIERENPNTLQILEEYTDSKCKNEFVDLLVNYESKGISENLIVIRRIIERLLLRLHSVLEVPRECYHESNPNRLILGKFIAWITWKDRDTNNYTRLGVNEVVEHSLKAVYFISCAYGAHTAEVVILPTKDTVQSLIFQLKDIILWFGSNMNK